MARSGARKPAPVPRSAAPLLSVADFRRFLVAKAAQIAPSDVTTLVGQVRSVRDRLGDEETMHLRFAQRAKVAMHLLGDHAAGRCPQIPYHTVSLLAAALFYYLNPVDVIPDAIPGVGTADDALVLDLAWEIGHPGIERYLVWKGITRPLDGSARPKRAAATQKRTPARGGTRRSGRRPAR